jgi:ribosomal protein L14
MNFNEGDIVTFDNNTYVIISDKDNNGEYILHPCGNNPNDNDVKLNDVIDKVTK